MSQYHAPLADMQFVLNELAGLDQVAAAAGLRGGHAGRRHGDPRGSGEVRDRRARSAQRGRRPRRLAAPGRRHGDRRRPASRTPTGNSARTAGTGSPSDPEYGGQGLPHAARHRGRGDVAFVEPRVQPVPDADAGRDRGDRASAAREALKQQVPAEHGRRHVDRHDEPHRAAGGLRPRGRAHEGGAAGRRHVQALRPEDLHHLRRARLHREHHPPGARAHAGRARGRQGHLALRRAQGAWSTTTAASARATTCSACRSSTSSASTRARRRSWRTATTAARSATSSARRTAASSTCSS